ncbi:replication terminator protein [Bacillus pumilus]|uniref:replication terminator protein n=2 Tax=Bacillus pumilus TaxID=1408 RepID=UPI0013748AE3|nr:replication terminator protein [Bacillus pumilus]QHQ75079.1 replication terminator protein [Bacillus pumilus]
MSTNINLNSFAEGALKEQFNIELQRILENIADPNTDPKAKRKLTIQVALYGDESRDVVFTNVVAKSQLAPAREVEAKLFMDTDLQGNVSGAELKSGILGQTYIDDSGDIAEHDGHKIINYQQKKSN